MFEIIKQNIIEEKQQEMKEIQTILDGYVKLDKSRREIFLATLTGMTLAVEADRRMNLKEVI